MDWDSSCLLINIWMETASDLMIYTCRGGGGDRDTRRQKKTDIETDRYTEGRERQTNTWRDTIQRYKRQTQRQTQIELERGTEEDRDIV